MSADKKRKPNDDREDEYQNIKRSRFIEQQDEYSDVNASETSEIWKAYPSNTRYEISKTGKVRNVKNWNILKPRTNRGGYEKVMLYSEGNPPKTFLVHVLVAETFIGPKPSPKHSVNHIIGTNKTGAGNSVSNLEWSTQSEQMKHAYASGLTFGSSKGVIQLSLKDGSEIAKFSSATAAAASLGHKQSRSTISVVCRGTGKQESALGFGWKFAETGIIDVCRDDEEWKCLIWEGNEVEDYQVSSHGRVKRNGRLLNPKIEKGKYVRVNLSIGHDNPTASVHILVAMAFIPNPDNKPEVNHIDEEVSNSHVSNLEWVTGRENMIHSRGVNVKQFTKDGLFVKEYNSINELKEVLKKDNVAHISACCRGRKKTAYGFKWQYSDNASSSASLSGDNITDQDSIPNTSSDDEDERVTKESEQ